MVLIRLYQYYIVFTGFTLHQVPSQRTPPRGRCKVYLFSLSWARYLSLEPWAIVATVQGRLNDHGKLQKTFLWGCNGTLCWFPNRTPPSCLQESRFINTQTTSSWVAVFTGNAPFPQPEGRRTLVSQEPRRCWFPLHPLDVECLFGQKLQKLKALFPTLAGKNWTVDHGRSMHCSGSSKLYWIHCLGCRQKEQKLSRRRRPPSSRWCFLARLASDGLWLQQLLFLFRW